MSEPKLREANEGQRIEDMRFELGKDAAVRGEPLHDGASEEFRHGYSSHKNFGGFSSNIAPRLFGKGRETLTDWECICGHLNKRYLKRCWECGLSHFDAARALENE